MKALFCGIYVIASDAKSVLLTLSRESTKHWFYNENKSLSEKFVSIGSCSTMTTLCSVFQNLPFYNPSKIEGFEMSREQVINTIT